MTMRSYFGRHRKSAADRRQEAFDRGHAIVDGADTPPTPDLTNAFEPGTLSITGVVAGGVDAPFGNWSTDEAKRQQVIEGAKQRAKAKQHREDVLVSRELGFQLGLEQGRADEIRRRERAEREAEEANALKTLRHPPFRAKVHHRGPATLVMIEVECFEPVLEKNLVQIGVGLSVCAPCDVYNAQIGTQIAYARAMRDLMDKFEADAATLTRHVKERY